MCQTQQHSKAVLKKRKTNLETNQKFEKDSDKIGNNLPVNTGTTQRTQSAVLNPSVSWQHIHAASRAKHDLHENNTDTRLKLQTT